MNLLKSKLLKSISMGLVTIVSTSGILTNVAFAQTSTESTSNTTVTNSTTSVDTTSFNIVQDKYTITYTIKKLDSKTTQVDTITTNASNKIVEKHTAIYNPENGYMLLDGKKLAVNFQKTYNSSKASINTVQSNIALANNVNTASVSEWTPVYVGSAYYSFSDTITGIGIVCTVVGGVIAGAALAGVAIAKTAIASSISNWASVVGLGSLVAGYYLNGGFYFDEYRTYGPVTTPYGSTQYEYRYQNACVKFTLKGYSYNQVFSSIGDWFMASKPF